MSPAKSPSSEFQDILNDHSQSIGLITREFQYMREGIEGIKKSIDSLKKEIVDGFVTKDQHKLLEKELSALKDDVKSMQDDRTWVVKIVVGAIILSLLALLGLRS